MQTADQLLLERWRAERDAAAFREITVRYAGLVYAAAKRVLKDASDAEDVAQECFEALAQRREAAPVYLGAWLHTVATNRALNFLESAQRRRAREERAAVATPKSRRTEWDDIYEHVDEVITALPEEYRAAIVGHFLEGQSKADLARAIGVSRPAIHYRIDKGLEQVRHALRRRGVTASVTAFASAMAAQSGEAAPASLVAALGKLSIIVPKCMGTFAAPTTATNVVFGMSMKYMLILATTLITFAGGSVRVLLSSSTAAPPIRIVHETDRTEAVAGNLDQGLDTPTMESVLNAPLSSNGVKEPGPTKLNADPGERDRTEDIVRGGFSISGHVTDDLGSPIKGAYVTLRNYQYRTTTRADGSFTLTGIDQGQYSGKVTHELHSDTIIELVDAGDQNVHISMLRRAKLSGRVIDSRTRQPIPRFTAYWQFGVGKGLLPGVTRDQQEVHNSRGLFEFKAVEAGGAGIVVLADGYLKSVTPFLLDAGENIRDITIEVLSGFEVDGKVVDESATPVGGAWIFSSPLPAMEGLNRIEEWTASTTASAWENLVGRSNDDGTFFINGLRGDEARLYAFHPQHGIGQASLSWSGTFPIRGLTLVVDHEMGAVNVLVNVGRQPAGGVKVSVRSPASYSETQKSGRTEADGHILLTELPATELVVAASYPGVSGESREIAVDAMVEKNKTIPIVIDFGSGTSAIRGVVLGCDLPCTMAHVELTDIGIGRTEIVRTQSTANGNFHIESLTPGEVSLKVVQKGDITRSKSIPITLVEGAVSQVDISFDGYSGIRGRVAGMLEGETGVVYVLPEEYIVDVEASEFVRPVPEIVLGMENFDSDGAFRIEGISSGRYTLVVSVTRKKGSDVTNSSRVATAFADVTEGEATTVDIDMDK